jgi:hypothetical protein
MKTKKHILLFICLISLMQSNAQSVKDSSFRIIMTGVHFCGQLPQNNMAQRFGPNLSAGVDLFWKTKRNFLFGIEGSYFWSKNVREDVVASMKNSDGFITDNEGYPADLRTTERGWNFDAKVGMILPKTGHNPNSGIFFTIGAGYMQHKVKLYDANQKIAAIKGDLAKGYDRLSGGFAVTYFIGYQYLSNNRIANFSFGVEMYQGFTQSFRGFNYDTGLKDTQKRSDVLVGLRFTWLLPLYKRAKDFYYY